MAATLATLLLFVWAALAFTALPERPNFSMIPIWRPRNPTLVILALLLGAIGFYTRYHFPNPNEIDNWFLAFLIDLAPEMVGMAFTIVVIDELNQRQLEQQEKDRLFAQVKSPVRDIAVEALRLIRENNWLGEVLEKYNSDLRGVQWQGADLVKANLQRADLRYAKLQGVDLSEANLQGTKLLGANLQEANLTCAKLQGVNLSEVNLQGINLLGANLEGADLFGANLEGADLTRANLQGANLLGANLQRADLTRANLQRANLLVANLEGANLTRANLQGADLDEANLQGADLDEANLQGADLDEANLQGTKYSAKTTWPENFDPERAGVIIKMTWDDEALDRIFNDG